VRLTAKGFQNRNGTFLGGPVAKTLKVTDARLRKAAAMKRARIVSDEPDELRPTRLRSGLIAAPVGTAGIQVVASRAQRALLAKK